MVAAVVLRNYAELAVKNDRPIEYHCSSCERCVNKRCSFFNRYVEPSYNRCVMHTNYVPTLDLKYVSPPESYFKEIQRREAARIRQIQKGK